VSSSSEVSVSAQDMFAVCGVVVVVVVVVVIYFIYIIYLYSEVPVYYQSITHFEVS
jgi:hypothetical protein